MLDRLEVGGENGSEAGVPRPGIQAQRPAPAPHASHARHDRSMARSISVARAKVGPFSSSPPVSRIYAPRQCRVNGVFWFILARNYRRLGVETERSGDPHRESKPSAHRHRTARTTRQINGAISFRWLGRK